MTFKLKKICIPITFILISAVLNLTGCGKSETFDLDSLYRANTTSSILENHSSISEEFTYYENLDDEATFRTSYCYTDDLNGKPVYRAEGFDALDETSDDNFIYCIVDNVEYFVNYALDMTVYPLTSGYIDEFRSDSFTVHINDSEAVSSVRKSGSDIIITTIADASDVYSNDTLKSLGSLCDDTVSEIRTVYTADRKTLLLSNVRVYYTGDKNDYLFSEETVTYDTEIPDLSFADEYINPPASRSVTVIEKTESGDTSNTYTLPDDILPDFKCFESYYGYTLFNDAAGLDPYITESSDSEGRYQNITLYAMIPDTQNDSGTSGASSDTAPQQ